MDLIEKAYEFAKEKHKNQTYGDKSFIYHPKQTYEIISTLMPEDTNLRCAGLLHDAIEDQNVTYEEIKNEFNEDIAGLCKEVTKSGYNTFPDLFSIRGTILLMASRLCNLTNMQDWSEERQERYRLKSKFWKS